MSKLSLSLSEKETSIKEVDEKVISSAKERDSFIDFSRFFHPSKWSQEDFTLYTMIIFIVILLCISIVNIVLFGLGYDASNQSAFGKTINGQYGIVTENGFSTSNAFYIVSWILLFLSLVASVFQFMSNIFLIKFSKRFIWWNQISMGSFLIIDIVYGAWWIAISQIIGLVLAQQRYFAWDKQDKKVDVDPYRSQLNAKWLVIVIIVAAIFVLASILLITPIIFTDNKEFYTYIDGNVTSDLPDEGVFIAYYPDFDVTAYSYTVESGVLYDVAPWWDMVVGIFQVSGLILLTRKTFWAWVSFEVAMAAQMVVYFDAGNLILSIQSVLLFISNLLPLYYWFVMNKKSARRAKKVAA